GQAIAIDKVVDAKANALGGAQFVTAAVAAPTVTAGAATVDAFSLTSASGTVSFAELDLKDTTTAKAGQALATHINAKIGETGIFAEADATTGALTLTSVKDSVDKDGAVVQLSGTDITLTANAAVPTKQFADSIDVSTVKGAQQALEIVDKALSSINNTRADLGAIQNRFTSVVANLQTSSENLSASRSRISDTDFAKETAELTRTQILQQAGTAMLAQANQVPQNVLSLLR
ncbi:flagellin, partial [Stenotrophomonas sp.]|uniref:flagellin n=1 Tax=Stenotrophomonas sp. TaxID=69392 RepID=UPI002FC94ECE